MVSATDDSWSSGLLNYNPGRSVVVVDVEANQKYTALILSHGHIPQETTNAILALRDTNIKILF